MFDLIGFCFFVRKMKCRCKSSIYGTVWGAKTFPALWPFAEGLSYLKRGQVSNNFIIFLYRKGFKYKIKLNFHFNICFILKE
jgi:hypothetical protein